MLLQLTRRQVVRSGRRNFSTLLVVDNDARTGMGATTLNVLSAVKKYEKGDINFFATTKEAAEQASKYGKTFLCEGAKTADVVCDAIKALTDKHNYSHVVGSIATDNKDALPRLGAHFDVQPISDVVEVKSADTFIRPIYAGNAMATVQSTDSKKIITVRPTNFELAEEGNASNEIVTVSVPASSTGVEFISESVKADDKPQLGSSKIVVGGGRALGSSENFEKVLQPLCDKLNAAMGASRAAVDAGYVPNELQVGQTGKVVAPDLYIAVGISGAIQHLAGMKDSKTIVCINKDPDAAIFQVSDYGLVDDLFKAVPEMTEKV